MKQTSIPMLSLLNRLSDAKIVSMAKEIAFIKSLKTISNSEHERLADLNWKYREENARLLMTLEEYKRVKIF